MAGGELSLLQEHRDLAAQLEQPQGVGDGGAALPHAERHHLLGEAVVLHKGLISPGLLQRIQVLPLQVFHQGQLLGLPVVGLHHPDGDVGESRQAAGPPAPLPGDDLIEPGVQPPDGDGLEQAVLGDGFRQLLQGRLVKLGAGLTGPGFDFCDGQGIRGGGVLTEEGPQAGTQPLFSCHRYLLLWNQMLYMCLWRRNSMARQS